MNQSFDGDVMRDLGVDTPAACSEESLGGMEGAEEDFYGDEDSLEAMDLTSSKLPT